MQPTPQSPRLHWLFSVARVSGKPCSPTCSAPPSIVYPNWWLSCSTLLRLPPAPRTKLVRTVRSTPSVSTSPSLMYQLWISPTAFPPAGSRVTEHCLSDISAVSTPFLVLLSFCRPYALSPSLHL